MPHHLASSSSSAKDSSSPLTNISNLPDDVLVEIFVQMPFRSVAKCKCVCKRWSRVIKGPSFSTEFVSRQHSLFSTYLTFLSPHHLILGFFPKDLDLNVKTHRVPLSPDTLIQGDVCGYSNGLLLCCSNRYTTGRGYFVYDPLTKKCTHIPSFPDVDEGRKRLYAVGFLSHTRCLEQEKDGGLSDHSFWVVVIRTFIRNKYDFEVLSFSSEKGKWRQTLANCDEGFAFAPHWMFSFAFKENLYFMGSKSIFVFGPKLLFSSTISYPHDADAMNTVSFGYLGCSGGSMRIAEIGHDDLRVWELRHSHTWDLVHRTSLSDHLPSRFCSNCFKRVAGFHPYDGDTVYLYSYVDGIFVANLRTKKFVPIPGYDKSDISPFQLELSPIPYD